jgi:FkbM family methyltransferase
VITNTKVLFGALLKSFKCDCICDIGSRDGDQALLFRHLCPSASIVAFEANPSNFQSMSCDPRLFGQRIMIFPFAISDSRGRAQFNISDVDYSDPLSNKGTSSLLKGEGLKMKGAIEVETRRIDEVVLETSPAARSVGLWIDVEGAEFAVLSGIDRIKDRVVAIHVETAKAPLRQGQRPLADVVQLMDARGFDLCGSNIGEDSDWGDVVFVNRAVARSLGTRLSLCKLKGYLGLWIRADHAAVFLKSSWPAGYRFFRRAYLKLGV